MLFLAEGRAHLLIKKLKQRESPEAFGEEGLGIGLTQIRRFLQGMLFFTKWQDHFGTQFSPLYESNPSSLFWLSVLILQILSYLTKGKGFTGPSRQCILKGRTKPFCSLPNSSQQRVNEGEKNLCANLYLNLKTSLCCCCCCTIPHS